MMSLSIKGTVSLCSRPVLPSWAKPCYCMLVSVCCCRACLCCDGGYQRSIIPHVCVVMVAIRDLLSPMSVLWWWLSEIYYPPCLCCDGGYQRSIIPHVCVVMVAIRDLLSPMSVLWWWLSEIYYPPCLCCDGGYQRSIIPQASGLAPPEKVS